MMIAFWMIAFWMRLSMPNKIYSIAKNSEALMHSKLEKIKMEFFVNFDLFSGISLILPINITAVFAATDISTYFKNIPIDIFMKTFFSDDI